MYKNPPRIRIYGASGRFYGWIDPATLIIELKRKGAPAERIDLKPLLKPLLKKPR